MPTRKQLDRQLETDFEFGRLNDRGSEHTQIGEHASIPESIRRKRENPQGEVLGHLVWDEEAQDMKLIPTPSPNTKA